MPKGSSKQRSENLSFYCRTQHQYRYMFVSDGTERARWALQGLLVRPTATAQQYDIPVKSQLEGKVRRATSNTSQLRTSPYRVRLYQDRALKPDACDDTANGTTFLETTDIQKEFYFTHDSGRVKSEEWGKSGGSCQ